MAPLPLGMLLALLWMPVPGGAAWSQPALRLGPDSTANRELVALGRDLVVEGVARSDAVAVGGSILVRGRVEGDVIALDGDVRLVGPAASVRGDVFVLGGDLHAESDASIGGRVTTYPTAGSAWMSLLEGPALGFPGSPIVVIGAKLALLGGWLLVTILLLLFGGRGLIATAAVMANEPLRDLAVGLASVFALGMTALFLVSLAPGIAGLPLLVVLVLAALALKLWGVAAAFYALGDWLARRLLHRRPQAMQLTLLGFAVLGALKLVPYLGVWVWSAVSLLGIGATLRFMFGQRQAWLGVGDLERLASLTR